MMSASSRDLSDLKSTYSSAFPGTQTSTEITCCFVTVFCYRAGLKSGISAPYFCVILSTMLRSDLLVMTVSSWGSRFLSSEHLLQSGQRFFRTLILARPIVLDSVAGSEELPTMTHFSDEGFFSLGQPLDFVLVHLVPLAQIGSAPNIADFMQGICRRRER